MSTSRLRQVSTQHHHQFVALRLRLQWTLHLDLSIEHIEPVPAEEVAPAPVAEYITPAPMEFVEAALHEIDEELCSDEIKEPCHVARVSAPGDASGTAAHLLQTLQNLKGHGEHFRHVCVMSRGSSR